MSDKQQLYRSEHDSVGERAVPKDVYYGVQSLRAAENFPITGLAMHPELINSIAEIKKIWLYKPFYVTLWRNIFI